MIQKFTSFFFTFVLLFVSWSAASGQVNTVIQSGHFRPVTEIAVDQSGRYCATTDGRTIKAWDLRSGIELGEITTGADRNDPITNLAFIADSNALVLSFVTSGRLIFKDIRSNKLVPMKRVKREVNDTLSELDIIKRKFANRDTDYKQMKKYDKAITKLNEEQDEQWKDYIREMPYQDCRISKMEMAYYKVSFEKAKRFKKELKRKSKVLESSLKKSNEANSNSYRSQLFALYNHKWKRKSNCVVLYKSNFNGKRSQLLKLPFSYMIATVNSQSLWLNAKETYAVVGKALVNLHTPSRAERKRTKKVVAVFPDTKVWSLFAMSPNEKLFARGGVRGDSTELELYSMERIQRTVSKKRELKKDTAYHLPVIRTFRMDGVKSMVLTDEALILLKHDGKLVAFRLSDWKNITEYFYPSDSELEPFTRINALSYDAKKQTCLITGLSDKYENICFRLFSLKTMSYGWSVGSEFAAARLSVLHYGDNKILTGVNGIPNLRNGNGLISKIMSNTSTIGCSTIDLRTLNVEGFSLNASAKYAPNFEYAIGNDSSGYYFSKRVSNSKIPLNLAQGLLTVLWSDDSEYAALYAENSLYLVGKEGGLLNSWTLRTKIENIDFDNASSRLFVLDENQDLLSIDLKNGQNASMDAMPMAALSKALGSTKSKLRKAGMYAGGAMNVLTNASRVANGAANMKNSLKKGGAGGTFNQNSGTTIERGVNDIETSMTNLKASSDSMKNVEARAEAMEARDRAYRAALAIPSGFQMSKDAKRVLYFSDNCHSLRLLDLSGKKPKKVVSASPLSFGVRQAGLSFMQRLYLESNSNEGREMAELMREFRMLSSIRTYTAIDSAWNTLVYAQKLGWTKSKYMLKNLNTGKGKKLKFKSGGKPVPFISPSGRYLALSCSDQLVTTIRVYDLQQKSKCIKKILGHAGAVYFSPDEKFMISCGNDNQLKVWDLSVEQYLVDRPLFSYVVCSNATDALIYNNSGYYMTKNPSLNTIAFNTDGNTYPLEQFDLLRNRPDSIMRDVNKLTSLDINQTSFSILENLTRVRLATAPNKNLPSNGSMVNFPTIDFYGEDAYDGLSETVLLNYALNSSSDQGVVRVEIMNNNVPWKTIELDNVRSHAESVKLPLLFGANHLKITAISKDGKRSLSRYTLLRRKDASNALAQRKRHIVLIGIDKYAGTSLPDLNRAVSDCNKLEALFTKHSKGIAPENVKVHRLLNEAANLQAIQILIDSLKSTDVNDEVIIVLAGHGKFKKEFEFVLPGDGGNAAYWSYNQMMSDLGRINAARKLVLLDACQSGLGLENAEFTAQDVELYFKMFFNYSVPNGVQVISSAYSTERARDGYFSDAIESVLSDTKEELSVALFFERLKQKNVLDPAAKQKFNFTNPNPEIHWSLFSPKY